jgi:hypothetical protein
MQRLYCHLPSEGTYPVLTPLHRSQCQDPDSRPSALDLIGHGFLKTAGQTNLLQAIVKETLDIKQRKGELSYNPATLQAL